MGIYLNPVITNIENKSLCIYNNNYGNILKSK